MVLRRAVAVLVALVLGGPPCLRAQAAPTLVAVFPLGGQRGTAVEVELRGTGLEGSHAVWLGPGTRLVPLDSPAGTRATKGPDGVEAHVQAVPDGSRAKVRLVMAPDARVGFHPLSLVSPR